MRHSMHKLTHLRHRGSCAPLLSMYTFSRTPPPPNVRALRSSACSSRNRVPGHVVLALQQLPHFLALPFLYARHLASVLLHATVLPQLDEPVPPSVAHWRRSGCDSHAGERGQNHHSNTDEMETWPVCVYSNARYLGVRKPPLHNCIAMRR